MPLVKVPSSRDQISLSWLQSALAQYPFQILDYSWKGQVGDGIGALSSLERLILDIIPLNSSPPDSGVHNQIQQLSIVVKTLPKEPTSLRAFVINEGFCQREYKMYTKVFPSWRKFQESRNTPDSHQFRYPTCYYAAEQGEGLNYNMILLLEDMHASGFQSWSEGYRKALRWTQAQHIVKEIALFHAVGMAFKEYQGLKHYSGEEYSFLFTHSKDQAALDNFLRSGIQVTCKMLRDSEEEVPSGLIEDIESFSDIRRLQELSFPREDRAGTVTHQDLHVNNVMFNSSLNFDSSAALLDFQGCSYANPMSDLTFFLLLCCDPSLFTFDLPKVLEYYCDELHKALYSMDSDVKYPLEEINEDYHSSLFVSIVHIILGSSLWCFGNCTNEDTSKRYRLALVDSYKKCGYRLGLHSVGLGGIQRLENCEE